MMMMMIADKYYRERRGSNVTVKSDLVFYKLDHLFHKTSLSGENLVSGMEAFWNVMQTRSKLHLSLCVALYVQMVKIEWSSEEYTNLKSARGPLCNLPPRLFFYPPQDANDSLKEIGFKIMITGPCNLPFTCPIRYSRLRNLFLKWHRKETSIVNIFHFGENIGMKLNKWKE